MEERWYVNPEDPGSSPGPVKVFFANFTNWFKFPSQSFPCLFEKLLPRQRKGYKSYVLVANNLVLSMKSAEGALK